MGLKGDPVMLFALSYSSPSLICFSLLSQKHVKVHNFMKRQTVLKVKRIGLRNPSRISNSGLPKGKARSARYWSEFLKSKGLYCLPLYVTK